MSESRTPRRPASRPRSTNGSGPAERHAREPSRMSAPPAGDVARLATAPARAVGGLAAGLGGIVGRAVSGVAAQTQQRVPAADLDERDPDYIRETLPGLWMLASLYFRADVRGLENIPEEGPVLLVGNHSGGNMTPDTGVFILAFSTYFGVERHFHQLAHNLVLTMPGLGFLRKYGTVAATPSNAARALSSGAALLVYPGGDYEVHRPTSESGRVDFDGRKGFLRLALEHDVPIVPVVSIGGQETALFLSRGEGLAKLLRLDRMFRLKVLPISLALPWGLNVGDMLGHLPAPVEDHDPGAGAHPPARGVRREPGPERDVRRRAGADAEDAHRTAGGADPAAPRLMRVERKITIDAPREEIWERVKDPTNYPQIVEGITRCLRQEGSPDGLGRPLLAAHARGLGRRGRRGGGGGVPRASAT